MTRTVLVTLQSDFSIAVIGKSHPNLSSMKMRTLWVKKEFFDLIVAGQKTLEVRVLYSNLKSMKKGDFLNLNNQLPIRVKDIRIYSSFKEMLSREDAFQIWPGKSSEQILNILKSLYPREKEKLGVVVLELGITV